MHRRDEASPSRRTSPVNPQRLDRDRSGDTAGFGRGAMVAAFAHECDGAQSQSLASSTDGGTTWRLFAGNPVLTSDAPTSATRSVCVSTTTHNRPFA